MTSGFHPANACAVSTVLRARSRRMLVLKQDFMDRSSL
jgi:hypothetical protein